MCYNTLLFISTTEFFINISFVFYVEYSCNNKVTDFDYKSDFESID